ncbi:NAD(P)-binding protein [Hypoxylon crocopeplum]|nr:NAD(P)-binding protein [Hypoxylon crocopeplum]
MSAPKRTVLITGCSDGGSGAALAVEFHKAGLHVYATARNPAKMKSLAALGIEVLALDVLSESSIAECVGKVPSLDILVNNAGQTYSMPIADLDIPEARKLFDINVWAPIAVTQAFLPLLLKSPNAMVINHTSATSVAAIPFQAAYNASKAAMAMLSDCLRLELQPFNIKVIDLRSGGIKTNIVQNLRDIRHPAVPKGSIYEPAKEVIDKVLRGEQFEVESATSPAEVWAKQVVQDVLKKNPPPLVWRGQSAGLARLASILPFGFLDGMLKKMSKLDVIEQIVRK